jgi:predicted ribosomally synthesized peptide with nif11-like leader
VRGLQLIDEDTHVHFFVVPDSRPLYNGHRKMSNQKENTIMNIDESILSKLTDEQKKKAQSAQSPEEILAIAKEAGYELSAEQLEAIAGGKWEPCWENCITHARCPYYEI